MPAPRAAANGATGNETLTVHLRRVGAISHTSGRPARRGWTIPRSFPAPTFVQSPRVRRKTLRLPLAYRRRPLRPCLEAVRRLYPASAYTSSAPPARSARAAAADLPSSGLWIRHTPTRRLGSGAAGPALCVARWCEDSPKHGRRGDHSCSLANCSASRARWEPSGPARADSPGTWRPGSPPRRPGHRARRRNRRGDACLAATGHRSRTPARDRALGGVRAASAEEVSGVADRASGRRRTGPIAAAGRPGRRHRLQPAAAFDARQGPWRRSWSSGGRWFGTAASSSSSPMT